MSTGSTPERCAADRDGSNASVPFAAGLYAIADADAYGDVLAAARMLRDAGAPIVQVRMKHRPTDEVRAVVGTLAPEFATVAAMLVLNDHPEIAAGFPGVGVHLGTEDMDPVAARRLLPESLIGLSTHDSAQVRAAASLPVDYIGFGPVFSAATKHLHPSDGRRPDRPVGIDGLSEAVRLSSVPLVAIGGIDTSRRSAVLDTGAEGIAVIGAIAKAVDPEAAAAEWVRACRR